MMHGFSPQYVWVREQHTSKNPHYHFVLFLDANRIQYFNRMKEAKWLWVKAICKFNPGAQAMISPHLIHKDQSVYHSQQINHGLIVTRNNRALQEEAIRFGSYIAKINTKEATPFNCNCFHASQLPETERGWSNATGSRTTSCTWCDAGWTKCVSDRSCRNWQIRSHQCVHPSPSSQSRLCCTYRTCSPKSDRSWNNPSNFWFTIRCVTAR